MSTNTPQSLGEVEAALMRESALRGHAAEVLARYKRVRAHLCYLRLAACNPASLMGGKLPPSDDAELNALTPAQLDKCAAEAMSYLLSLIPPK